MAKGVRVRRPEVGRADLLRVIACIRDSGASDALERAALERGAARALGFDWSPAQPPEPKPPEQEQEQEPEPESPPLPDSDTGLPEIPFWQPRRLEWRSAEELQRRLADTEREALAARARDAQDVAARSSERPCPEPLTRRARLVPMLGQALCQDLPSREIDVPGVVARLSRGECVASLPRLRRRRWPRVVVIRDFSSELVPIWRDLEALCALLVGILGPLRVAVVDLEEGDEPDAIPASWIALQAPVVLAVSDLGWYGDGARRRSWLRLGRRLQRTPVHLHALVPVPPSRWTGKLARIWSPLPWERPAAGDSRADQGAERLLELAACTRRLEPGLLRDLRRLLPASEVDIASELAAWNHSALAGRAPGAAVLKAEEAERRVARFAHLDPGLRGRVFETIRRWHWRAELPPEIWHMEALALTDQGAETLGEGAVARIATKDLGHAERFLTRLQADLRARAGAREDERRWLHHGSAYGPGFLPPTGEAGRMLQLAWGATHAPEELPPHPDPALLAQGRRPRPGELRRLVVRQVGEALGVAEAAGVGHTAEGGLVGELWASEPVVVGPEVEKRRLAVSAPGELVVRPSSAGPIELRTDRSTLHLAPLVKPPWARAIGRDRFGLWVEAQVIGRGGVQVGYRLRWIPPGRFLMGSPPEEEGRFDGEGPQHAVVIRWGFWLGETQVTQEFWEAVTGENPSYFRGGAEAGRRPVERVSWEDCQERLIAALNADPWAKEAGEERPWRLPTEAEWEYACRAGTTGATYAEALGLGLGEIAWIWENSGERTHPVGEKVPNPWGLYDMLGNVDDWCEDWWDYRSYGEGEDRGDVVADPMGPATGKPRVIRGGAWDGEARVVRAAYRLARPPVIRFRYLGLRLARDQVR